MYVASGLLCVLIAHCVVVCSVHCCDHLQHVARLLSVTADRSSSQVSFNPKPDFNMTRLLVHWQESYKFAVNILTL